MEYDLHKFTNKVNALTEFIHESISTDILPNQESSLAGSKKYLYTLLFKTNNSLNSANIFFHNLGRRSHHTDSGFLILRTILSDNIIYLYLLLKSNGSDEEFEKNIKSLEYDHIQKEIHNIKSIYQHSKNKSPKEVESMIQVVKERYSEFFDDFGKAIYQQIKPSVSTAIKCIINNKDKADPELGIVAFNLYTLFSKYEHFGYYTFDLIHRQFDSKNLNRIFDEYFDTINIVMRFYSNILKAWYTQESDKYERFLLYQRELGNIKLYITHSKE